MKRTRFPSTVLLASVLVSTATSATFAGGHHGGGNSFKGNGGGMQSTRSVGQFKQNVGNNFVQKQQFNQKFSPTPVKLPTTTTADNLGNVKTFPNNHVITGKNTGIVDKIKVPVTLPSSPTGPFNPGNKTGGIKISDKIKVGPMFPSPTSGIKVPTGPILPPSGGGSGSGSGGGSGGGSGSGSGGGSGGGSGSGSGSGNCHSHHCGNWWFPVGWGWGYNNCYGGYCGTYPTYCGTGYYGTGYCNTYGPPVYTNPIVVNPAPVSVSTPVVVNVDAKEDDQVTSVASTQSASVESASKNMLEMTLGQTYTLQGPGLGNEAGRLMLEVSDIALGVKVEEWSDAKVGFTLPMFGLSKPTAAKLHVVSTEGKLLRSSDVRLVLPQTTTAQN